MLGDVFVFYVKGGLDHTSIEMDTHSNGGYFPVKEIKGYPSNMRGVSSLFRNVYFFI